MPRMTAGPATTASPEFVLTAAYRFVRTNAPAVLFVSVVLLAPCFWHSRIEAGDLGSHIYNAWLGQLVERHQVEGLVVVRQWTNVLFDLLVLKCANLFGFVVAERVAVPLGVLIFFWGGFSFISGLSGRPPWTQTPLLFVLAYGYAFQMGFMNYYLSVGLALFALSAACMGGAGNWLAAAVIGAIALLAHPIGFAIFVGVALYIQVWRLVPRWLSLAVLTLAVAAFALLRWHFSSHEALQASWRSEGFFQLLGQDQINVYGRRYEILSWFALIWALSSAIGGAYDWLMRAKKPARGLFLALELYAITVVGTVCLPENFHTDWYAGWVGLLVSRVTLVTAVLGLGVLSCLQLPRWSWRGSVAIAAVFAVFLCLDTGKLDRMEANARTLSRSLSPGTRIVAVANPPEDWRVPFIYHSIDRACIGHCFSFANYEPSSLQFRVRALPGNLVVTASVDQSDDMSSGDYVVRKADLPLISIYQCDDNDWARLCALPLREGQKTEDPESEPGPVPSDPEAE